MAEEEKKETPKASENLKMLGKYLIGILLIVIGGALGWAWRGALIELIKGCLGLFLILVGLVFVAIAKE